MSRRARLAIVAGCATVALAGCALGMRLAGSSVHDTALGEVALTVEPSLPGRVDVFIPLANWGVRVNAFAAPIEIGVQARSVEREALLRAAGGDRTVLTAARGDAGDATRDALVRAATWSAVTAFVLAALLGLAMGGRMGSLRRCAALAGACGALAGLVAGGSGLAAHATFDGEAFEQPDFYARGAELGQLLKVAEESQEAAAGYSSDVDRTLGGFASLLAGAARLGDRAETDTLALASDLHANRLVLEPISDVFAGQPVFFAGDLGVTGSEAEADLLAEGVAGLGSPVVAVSGNHDSRLIMERLAEEGATVLDGEGVVAIAGRTVAGLPDPLESRASDPSDPERIFSFSEMPQGDERFAAAERDVIEWFESLPERPQIVMIHQNGLAQGLARHVSAQAGGEPLTVLTGHDHEQHVDRYEHVVVVNGGSVGAGGVWGLGSQEIGLANLHFTGPDLRAVDLIRMDPLSGAAEAERIALDAADPCEKELLVCHDEGERPGGSG